MDLPAGPIYPVEREVDWGLPITARMTAASQLSSLPCHPLYSMDTVDGPNPPCGVMRQDSATGSSFSLCHSKITAKTQNGDVAQLQRSVTEILVTLHLIPHTQILCLLCIIQFGRDK